MRSNERKWPKARIIAIADFADGMWGIAFPDAPGCTAMAEGLDGAILAASENLTEWMRDNLTAGRSTLDVSDYPAIVGRADVKTSLANGAVLVSVPMIVESGKLARANISMDVGILNAIDEHANHVGVTRSSFLVAAAMEKLCRDS